MHRPGNEAALTQRQSGYIKCTCLCYIYSETVHILPMNQPHVIIELISVKVISGLFQIKQLLWVIEMDV
jgi:hypothetical protein